MMIKPISAKKQDQKNKFYQEVILGERIVEIIYENEFAIAFKHTKPSYTFHIVIIPKEYFADAAQIDNSQYLLGVFDCVAQISKNFDLELEGLKLITNLGIFQDSDYLHFHLIDNIKL